MTTESKQSRTDRRKFLRLGAAMGGLFTACTKAPTTAVEDTEPSSLGKPLSAYGERSGFEKSKRLPTPAGLGKSPEIGSSRTPLQDSYGIITPSSLHFERHHSGVPAIDPAKHRLLIHGMVERPLMLSVDEMRRLPSVSQIHVV